MSAPQEKSNSPLARPVETLLGVGPERAKQLGRLGVLTVEDLLLHRPRRYEDRRQLQPIAQLQPGAPALLRGTVVALGVKWFHHHQKSIFELILDDGTARLHCRWWNLPFLEKQFQVGQEVLVSGKPISIKPRTIDHPETEVVETGEENFIHLNRLTPVYPLTEGLGQRWLRSLVWRTLAQFESRLVELWPENGLSGAPDAGLASPSQAHLPVFPTRAQAVRMLHFPEQMEDIERARKKLALDEFISLQRQMLLRRHNFEAKAQALPCGGDNHLIKPFLAKLGFELTGAQTKVLREIRKDMSGPHPMRRLLQGEVGSGKTVVAACGALMALEGGFAVALMAPTEVLAEQHFRNFKAWFAPLGLAVHLQTGSVKTVVQSALKPVGLFIGTHALLTAGLELPELGLVIIDEQHKFGVSQREQLVRKGRYPHLLVMTATPIPRTLGLTVYADLDLSTIDQLPPARGKIKTYIRAPDKLPKVWAFLREQLREGRQAYVVYPRLEEATRGVKAVRQQFESLQQELEPFVVGLVHGELNSREKEEAMTAFRGNRVQVLLATSVVEVGLDVANATVLVVENAEQFGLAQLHQLRGRIGRGAHTSYCILVTAAKGKDVPARLKVLEETTDGFKIAQADLELRGPGEMLGQEQSGVPDFRFGDLKTDWELIRLARKVASQMLLR